jgi:hypothetical protein
MGIHLLINNPLFAGMMQAKISGLRPGCEMKNLIVLYVVKFF